MYFIEIAKGTQLANLTVYDRLFYALLTKRKKQRFSQSEKDSKVLQILGKLILANSVADRKNGDKKAPAGNGGEPPNLSEQ